MAWYYLIYGLVLIAVSSALIRNGAWRQAFLRYYLPLLGLLLLVFVVFRSSTVDHDYQDYLYWFDSIVPESLSDVHWNHDPMFFLASWLASSAGLSYRAVLAFYSTLALIFVFLFSSKVRNDRWLTLLLYLTFCHFFIEYEMTAIRAAVAIPLASLSLLAALERKVAQSIFLFVLALAFHLSALAVLPLLILFHCR
ncbi:MAG: EpsG family protein, partial [Acidobacteriota bacterium]